MISSNDVSRTSYRRTLSITSHHTPGDLAAKKPISDIGVNLIRKNMNVRMIILYFVYKNYYITKREGGMKIWNGGYENLNKY